MQKPTSVMAPAASHGSLEQSVPRVMKAAPTQASPRYASKRARGPPVNSTSTSSANEPKAAKSDVCGFPMTLSASAKAAGITIAARAALFSAAGSTAGDDTPASCTAREGDGRRRRDLADEVASESVDHRLELGLPVWMPPGEELAQAVASGDDQPLVVFSPR